MKVFLLSRFAPSLSGELHLGNLLSLYLSSIFSQKVIWRVDSPINNREDLQKLRIQLKILKIPWLKVSKISLLNPSFKRYKHSIDNLLSMKVLYREVNGGDKGCLKLSLKDGQSSWIEANGRKISISLKEESNPIVVTSSGKVLYSLASAIWDIEEGIDLIIRGRDLISSTSKQMIIFNALGRVPSFLHHGLLLSQGEKISKRKEKFWSLNNLISIGIPILSLLKWINVHSKKLHYRDLDLMNFSTGDKSLDQKDVLPWLKKDFKKLTFEQIKEELPLYPDLKFLLDSPSREGLFYSLRSCSSSIIELVNIVRITLETGGQSSNREYLYEEFCLIINSLRLLFWNFTPSPSLEEALENLPPEKIVQRLKEFLRRWKNIKSIVAE